MTKLSGECLCGEIRYEFNGELGSIIHCHCSECRRWHGAAFRTRAVAKRADFKWLSGESLLGYYDGLPNVIKTFCTRCGSNLISLHKKDQTLIGLPLGGINEAIDRKPQYHIFVANKAKWFEITDNLPQFDELPSDPKIIHQLEDE